MTSHIQVTIKGVVPEKQEWLIALLVEMGFEGFEQFDNAVAAFIAEKEWDEQQFSDFARDHGLEYSKENIESQNWNALWESNFEPVAVDDFVFLRAAFHPPVEGFEHEIVITPKMSFGTGHHATTWMMMKKMQALYFREKEVFDFGTGTGVLAILAEKLGAEHVVAIDNDEWSIDNATENIHTNNCSRVELHLQDTAARPETFDIILANINKNVILDNVKTIASQLRNGGSVLFSGLLAEDADDIRKAAGSVKLNFVEIMEREKWICMLFNK